MKLLVIASLMVLAAARPQGEDVVLDAPGEVTVTSPVVIDEGSTLQDAGILRMESSQNLDGSFTYGFETTDPIQQDVAGQIKQIGEEVGVVMQGSYSFETEDEDGNTITVKVTWVADENGFVATSDSIPVAPVDPNADAQAAAYAAAGGVPEQPAAVGIPVQPATVEIPEQPVADAIPAQPIQFLD